MPTLLLFLPALGWLLPPLAAFLLASRSAWRWLWVALGAELSLLGAWQGALAAFRLRASAYHDTYYVAVHFWEIWAFVLAPAIVCLMLWPVDHRRARMPGWLAPVLFWAMHLSYGAAMLASLLTTLLPVPDRPFAGIFTFGSFAILLAAALLPTIVLASCVALLRIIRSPTDAL